MSRPIALEALPLPPGTPRKGASNDGTLANPCLSCGACCAHFRVSFYCGEIAGEDGAGIVPPEFVVQVGPLRAAMKGTEFGGNRCVALKGNIGQAGIHCSIYEQRPSPCREFEPWLPDGRPEPDCQRVRAKFGLPPLPALSPDDVDPPAHAA
mgnify:CR=1 FL=1|jgi:Predicted Fe-S-cluster oxidoreductase